MEIGELRHRITLQEPETQVSEGGAEETAWKDVATVWAKVEHLRGREYYAAAAVQAENAVIFTIRHLTGIDPRHRIRFRDQSYNIITVDNLQYQNRYQVIHAQEVSRGG
jgi:SPP1 family predicted phage head-tail adaptor